MTPQKNISKANGHAEPHGRSNGSGDHAGLNGHAQASTARDETPLHGARAASDDAGGLLVAGATSLVAAGANPEACADAAPAEGRGAGSRKTETPPRPPKTNGATTDNPKTDSKDKSNSKVLPEIPPSTNPLPADGWEYVEAVHERVDLIALEVSLLNSQDEKVRQRELACLRELAYGKTAPPADAQDPRFVLDLPRPNGSSEDED